MLWKNKLTSHEVWLMVDSHLNQFDVMTGNGEATYLRHTELDRYKIIITRGWFFYKVVVNAYQPYWETQRNGDGVRHDWVKVFSKRAWGKLAEHARSLWPKLGNDLRKQLGLPMSGVQAESTEDVSYKEKQKDRKT